MHASALLLQWGGYCWARNLWVLIIFLFFLPVMLPSVLPRLATDSSESVSWCLETSLFLAFYIFSYLLSKTMGCFSGCLMSSAGIQKLFCGIYSAFKCYFDEFVWEKVVSPSYSSAILGAPLSSVSSCHLVLISSASVRSIPFLSFIEPIFKCSLGL